MRFDSLGQFLDHLDRAGQLRRIKAPVDPELEITEIADRVMAEPDGGPALLFENVKGSPFPLAINVFGSAQRTAWALGAEQWGELEHRIAALLDLVLGGPPQGIRAKLAAPGRSFQGRPHPAQARLLGTLPGSGRDRQPLAGPDPDPEVLARGRRPLHNHAAGFHPRPRHRQAQRRHVPPAGIRRSDPRPALAAAQGRAGALHALAGRRAHRGRGWRSAPSRP